jgi:hypothetical protein
MKINKNQKIYFNNGLKELFNFRKNQMSKAANIFFILARVQLINKLIYRFPLGIFPIKIKSRQFKKKIKILKKSKNNKKF